MDYSTKISAARYECIVCHLKTLTIAELHRHQTYRHTTEELSLSAIGLRSSLNNGSINNDDTTYARSWLCDPHKRFEFYAYSATLLNDENNNANFDRHIPLDCVVRKEDIRPERASESKDKNFQHVEWKNMADGVEYRCAKKISGSNNEVLDLTRSETCHETLTSKISTSMDTSEDVFEDSIVREMVAKSKKKPPKKKTNRKSEKPKLLPIKRELRNKLADEDNREETKRGKQRRNEEKRIERDPAAMKLAEAMFYSEAYCEEIYVKNEGNDGETEKRVRKRKIAEKRISARSKSRRVTPKRAKVLKMISNGEDNFAKEPWENSNTYRPGKNLQMREGKSLLRRVTAASAKTLREIGPACEDQEEMSLKIISDSEDNFAKESWENSNTYRPGKNLQMREGKSLLRRVTAASAKTLREIESACEDQEEMSLKMISDSEDNFAKESWENSNTYRPGKNLQMRAGKSLLRKVTAASAKTLREIGSACEDQEEMSLKIISDSEDNFAIEACENSNTHRPEKNLPGREGKSSLRRVTAASAKTLREIESACEDQEEMSLKIISDSEDNFAKESWENLNTYRPGKNLQMRAGKSLLRKVTAASAKTLREIESACEDQEEMSRNKIFEMANTDEISIDRTDIHNPEDSFVYSECYETPGRIINPQNNISDLSHEVCIENTCFESLLVDPEFSQPTIENFEKVESFPAYPENMNEFSILVFDPTACKLVWTSFDLINDSTSSNDNDNQQDIRNVDSVSDFTSLVLQDDVAEENTGKLSPLSIETIKEEDASIESAYNGCETKTNAETLKNEKNIYIQSVRLSSEREKLTSTIPLSVKSEKEDDTSSRDAADQLKQEIIETPNFPHLSKRTEHITQSPKVLKLLKSEDETSTSQQPETNGTTLAQEENLWKTPFSLRPRRNRTAPNRFVPY